MAEPTARVRLVRTPNGQRLDVPSGFALGGDEAISVPSVLDEPWPDFEDAAPRDVRL